MGRHRRIAAGRAATGRATGVIRTERSGAGSGGPRNSYAGEAPRGIAPYLNPEAYAEATAKAHAYLFAADDGGSAPGGNGFAAGGDPSHDRRRRKKAGKPVRAGLLGVSAAVALGTAAVATGVVPGLQNYQLGGATHTTGGERVQAVDTPSNTAAEQGGTSGSADSRAGGTGTGRNAARPESPSPSVSASASQRVSPSPTPSPSKTASRKPAPAPTPSQPKGTSTPSAAPSRTPDTPKAPKAPKSPKSPTASSAPVTVPARAAAEAEVLALVNQERAKVGCSPLAANSSLTSLAEAFSDDMAARDFFDHTDPNGRTPWDRAAAAGVTDLGGENIARGQADAAAVMKAWMNSPGHRANILNCDFKTLGVGVHFGPGGPWWTQDFGY